MNVDGKNYRTIWFKSDDSDVVCVIDQLLLPHQFVVEEINSFTKMVAAIKDMKVRGAGLIGAAAGYGMYLAAVKASKTKDFEKEFINMAYILKNTRPTAVNLAWAVDRQFKDISSAETIDEKLKIACKTAINIADEDVACCRQIGLNGVKLIEEISRNKNGETVNILTHCNAGWLAFVDYGSATSPIYEAFHRGIKVHVWVDETRPRNQGANLTAWELLNHGVPHTIIVDNTAGHLMQHGLIDLVITGADRVTNSGDAANKIGTYLKALAAKDNNVPFYIALPSSTFDWAISDGLKEIPIEQRNADEIKYIQGLSNGEITKVLITPLNSPARNFGFDVTPSRLITGFITERGICKSDRSSILKLYPENK